MQEENNNISSKIVGELLSLNRFIFPKGMQTSHEYLPTFFVVKKKLQIALKNYMLSTVSRSISCARDVNLSKGALGWVGK